METMALVNLKAVILFLSIHFSSKFIWCFSSALLEALEWSRTIATVLGVLMPRMMSLELGYYSMVVKST